MSNSFCSALMTTTLCAKQMQLQLDAESLRWWKPWASCGRQFVVDGARLVVGGRTNGDQLLIGRVRLRGGMLTDPSAGYIRLLPTFVAAYRVPIPNLDSKVVGPEIETRAVRKTDGIGSTAL
jgi:hypothetical protein